MLDSSHALYSTLFLYNSKGGAPVAIETTYSNTRAYFATFCDRATEDKEIIIIHRRNSVSSVSSVTLASIFSRQGTTTNILIGRIEGRSQGFNEKRVFNQPDSAIIIFAEMQILKTIMQLHVCLLIAYFYHF